MKTISFVMGSPFGFGCVDASIIGRAGLPTIYTTHRSQPGAVRLTQRRYLLAARDAPAATMRSVCPPGAVGGFY